MRKAQQFSRVFEKHGNSLPNAHTPTADATKLRQHLDHYASLNPQIYVGIVDNASFNAVACRHFLGDFIAIYIGAMTQITAYAYQLFKDPNNYPEIGDASIEKPDPEIIKRLLSEDWRTALRLRVEPSCSVRKNAADRIAECTCLILCLHEIAHIQGCHLDLICEEMGVSEYAELGVVPLTEEESLLLRALELEADSVGLVNALSIWRSLTSGEGYAGLEPIGSPEAGS